MADKVINVAKGQIAYYASLPASTDSLIAVPIETSGIVSDATMIDYTTLALLLAGASNEQTTMGRKTLTTVTVTVDQSNDRVAIDADDITWSAASGNAISALIICYVPTSGAADTSIIPMFKLDCVATPAGGDIKYQFNATGMATAS